MLNTLKTGYYLGIDTGATKTEAVITKESGYIVGVGQAGPANIHNASIDEAWESVQAAVEAARANAVSLNQNLHIEKFEVACVGLSGLDSPSDRQRISDYYGNRISEYCHMLNVNKLFFANNGLSGLMSGAEYPFGVCVIASTGSNCYGISKSGDEITAGGWGHLLGDQYSAFTLGRAVLRQVMREYDGRAPKSEITAQVLEILKLNDPAELIGWTYRDKMPVSEVASLACIYDSEIASETIELVEALNHASSELLKSYRAVITRLGLNEKDRFPVVLTGGLFKMNLFLKRAMRGITGISPNVTISHSTGSVGEGAARIARMHKQIDLFPDSIITFEPDSGKNAA